MTIVLLPGVFLRRLCML